MALASEAETPLVLVGFTGIADAFHRHPRTIRRWLRDDPDFPVAFLPNGQPATTPGMIERWLERRADAERARRTMETT